MRRGQSTSTRSWKASSAWQVTVPGLAGGQLGRDELIWVVPAASALYDQPTALFGVGIPVPALSTEPVTCGSDHVFPPTAPVWVTLLKMTLWARTAGARR